MIQVIALTSYILVAKSDKKKANTENEYSGVAAAYGEVGKVVEIAFFLKNKNGSLVVNLEEGFIKRYDRKNRESVEAISNRYAHKYAGNMGLTKEQREKMIKRYAEMLQKTAEACSYFYSKTGDKMYLSAEIALEAEKIKEEDKLQ